MPTDLEIAREAELEPIDEIGARLGLGPDDLERHGSHVAKVEPGPVRERSAGEGRLVLVTGISPTRAGEGKTTVAVGLGDGLRRIGVDASLCLREPSLGPIFGIKGGAAGGGRSQVVPMEEINLHFTGDLHAISSAHALLSAALDNRLHRGREPIPDPRRVTWPRAVDMNDRALRRIVVGLGGPTGGLPREDGFLITAASEVMAILCLASDLPDLRERLGRIVVGYRSDGSAVRAADLEVQGAMTLLLREALRPNLVQTLEGTPAFVHGGPFANIAHGCNSLQATRTSLSLADVTVTEAGFGSDLGAEKFFDIKCRAGGLEPDAAVLVATVRALKAHGGRSPDELDREDPEAVRRGLENLEAHLDIIDRFGVPPVVAINRFAGDTEAELEVVSDRCRELGVPAALSEGHARGGAGCEEVARRLMEVLEEDAARFEPLYPDDLPLSEKIETVVRDVYGGQGVDFTREAREDLERLESLGLGELPVCMAKTPASLTDDPSVKGRPRDFRVTVRAVTPSAGAGFVVARTGDVMVMPGLPERPAAEGMDVAADGTARGLF